RRSAAFWPWSVHPPLGHRSRGSRQLCRENQGQRWYDHFRTWRGRVEIPRARRHGCRNCRGRSLQGESGACVTRGPSVKRRAFITLLGGAAAWPLAVRAQQPAMPMVGFVTGLSSNYVAGRKPAFRRGLREVGYVEGQNVVVEYHSVEGQSDRLSGVVTDLIERKVAVIVAVGGTDPAKAAKAATTTIPIVFISAADP